MFGDYREALSGRGRLPFFFLPLLTMILVLGGIIAGCAETENKTTENNVACITEDGFQVEMAVFSPETKMPPGIIFVHGYGRSREVWKGFAEAAFHWGALVVAVDLRGHGNSMRQKGIPLHYRQLPGEGWMEALADIRCAKDTAVKQGAHPDNLAIVGEGLGANLALQYALQDSDIQAVVLLSPGLKLQGVDAEGAIQKLDNCPSLLAASEGDAYAAMSAAALHALAPVFSEHHSWPGNAHGADIMAARPESTDFVLQWLKPIILARPPTSATADNASPE